MKGQILSAISFLAATGAAVPGGYQDYHYDIPSCDKCEYPGREFFGNSNYKECPKEYRQCKDNYQHDNYNYDHHKQYSNQNSFNFELQYNEEVKCPKDYQYDLQVKIESCQSSDYHNQECLNVYYADGNQHKRSSISESNLGIYLNEKNYYNPKEFNYNNYCHEDRCEVPTESLPSYPDLCEKEIYLAVGNNRCYDDYSYDDYSQSTKYIKVKVGCNEGKYDYGGNHGYEHQPEEQCQEECCCYRS